MDASLIESSNDYVNRPDSEISDKEYDAACVWLKMAFSIGNYRWT